MEHVLDSPAWNALNTNNSNLAYGNSNVKYFTKEVSPFFGLSENSEENFRVLYDILPHTGPALLVTNTQTQIPARWKAIRFMSGLQMVHTGNIVTDINPHELMPLTMHHVPQMLALTQLTNPGPFDERTIDFGHYHGIFDGDKLVAMAGQRLHPEGYAEISAVCTHPDHLGRGYAKQLMLHQIHRINAEGETPFLHVRGDNERAINVYKSLGFETRTPIYFYVLVKA
ncbi:GNAT family N-acetyltransferase [Mucilaginibacter sp. HMF5004]|uniref:GNAT family N-acetyltransferase n=1 Tax=Mucilaginibacter rivuli TaxID=2857527 RepID=UPI001C5E7D50|nr:GNAT family N-acetyltransferase [Mucilaginibacter rivuli]MBW4888635.1 GNAT family N-acetyltransferase [Mucilaginibacter rivuli]